MCSNVDEQYLPPERYPTELCNGAKCVKCNEDAIIIIRKDHTFCSACFLIYANHKFRSTFGKSKVIRDGDKVLVGFSGGRCSTALLHMILQGKSPRTPKKLRFDPTLIYIDESTIQNRVEDNGSENEHILKSMIDTGLPCIACKIEQVMDERFISNDAETINITRNEIEKLDQMLKQLHLSESVAKLNDLLNSSKTVTSKEYLLRMLRQKLLLSYAKKTGHTHILLGNTASSLSIQFISDVVQGRGAYVSNELAFCQKMYDGVSIIQPLRDFLTKEIVMYNKWNNLECTAHDYLSMKADARASINQLTQSFISDLQSEYPSTVSTIFRTGEKLVQSNDHETDVDFKCSMCMLPLDTDVSSSSALSATLFSQKLCQEMEQILSNGNDNKCDTIKNSNCCNQGGNCHENDKMKINKELLLKSLCYGCRLILKDLNVVERLPESILEHSKQVNNRKQMKSQIEEFILDDT